MIGNGRPSAGSGFLVPIGGAEQKLREPLILGRFLYICGGRRADIVVVPTASRLADTGERYRNLFLHLGARSVEVLAVQTRRDAARPEAAAAIRAASGVFFTGGDQMRLARRITGTRLAEVIHEEFDRGTSVGGTSAGAAFLSERMIAYGKSGSTPRADMVILASGLGLTRRFVIDQHFRQRDRLGRLLTALSTERGTIGLGLDEDTAAFIHDGTIEVLGNGSITVVDTRTARACTSPRAGRSDPICLLDLQLHVLVHGSTFDYAGRNGNSVPADQEDAS
jgi:cyanophycinase